MLIKGLLLLCMALVVTSAQAGDSVKLCAPGQQKAMIAYEFPEAAGFAFGNVFVCTSKALNTEAGLSGLLEELQARHKGAIILSVTPLAS